MNHNTKMLATLGVVLFVLTLGLSAKASADSVYLGGWSKHLSSGNYNSNHKLVAYERDKKIVGHFVNSYDRDTWFAGQKISWSARGYEYGIYAGVTYGYRACLGRRESHAIICPAIAPFLSYTRHKIQPSIIMLADAVAITLRIKL
jgi:hypothetical protein